MLVSVYVVFAHVGRYRDRETERQRQRQIERETDRERERERERDRERERERERQRDRERQRQRQRAKRQERATQTSSHVLSDGPRFTREMTDTACPCLAKNVRRLEPTNPVPPAMIIFMVCCVLNGKERKYDCDVLQESFLLDARDWCPLARARWCCPPPVCLLSMPM